MNRSAMTPLLGPEFDPFLFAAIDEEGNGVSLSVLSAFAQLEVDPWREAAELARMPRGAANQRLTSLIAALSETSTPRVTAATIASRLTELLPRGTPCSVASPQKPLRVDPTPASHRIANMILINLLMIAGILCAQWALASRQPPHVGAVLAASSNPLISLTSQVGQLNR